MVLFVYRSDHGTIGTCEYERCVSIIGLFCCILLKDIRWEYGGVDLGNPLVGCDRDMSCPGDTKKQQ